MYNPITIISLVMLLGSHFQVTVTTANIADLGECLIAWLRPGYSFSLLHTQHPSLRNQPKTMFTVVYAALMITQQACLLHITFIFMQRTSQQTTQPVEKLVVELIRDQ